MLEATEADPAKRHAALQEALRVYRANAAAALTGRAEEWYLVQYAEDTKETRAIVADRLKRAKSKRRVEDSPWGASLTIRFLGRPVYDPADASLRHVSTEIPAYVGRLAGEGVILRGAIPQEEEEEQLVFDRAEAEARQPFLARTLHSTNPPAAQDATPPPSVSGNGLRAGVTTEGQLRPHAGTEDMLHRHPQSQPPSGSQRFAQWAESRLQSLESQTAAVPPSSSEPNSDEPKWDQSGQAVPVTEAAESQGETDGQV